MRLHWSGSGGSSCGTELGCTAGDPATRTVFLEALGSGTYVIVLDRVEPTLATGSGYEVMVTSRPR